jgi:hypothetical protein
MPTKAFVAILIASAAAALVLAYYSASWLWSIGNPAVALSGFDYHGGYFWTVVYVSTVVLWIIANVVLWQTRRAWALWSAFLFFAIFAFARLVVIDRIAAAFVESHRITTVSIYRYGALAFMLLFAAAAAITYFNQFLVLRLHERMFPPAEVASARSTEAEKSSDPDGPEAAVGRDGEI